MKTLLYYLQFLFVTAALVYAKDRKNLACDSVGYSKKLVTSDKPDLLIGQTGSIVDPGCSLCHISSNDSAARFFTGCSESFGGLDYDTRTKSVYRSGPRYVVKRRIDGSEKQNVIVLDESLVHRYGSIVDVSLDWVARNLYVLQESALGILMLGDSKTIYYLLTEQKKQSADFPKLRNLFSNAQLIARPNDGYVFIATNESIYRINSDGSEITTLTTQGGKPFTIDDYGTILYTTHNGVIYRMDMQGKDIKSLNIQDVDRKSDLAVDDEYVYYVPIKSDMPDVGRLVLRAHKFDGKEDVNFVIYGSDNEIKSLLYLNRKQELKRHNPCNFERQFCVDGFCFKAPGNETSGFECKGTKLI